MTVSDEEERARAMFASHIALRLRTPEGHPGRVRVVVCELFARRLRDWTIVCRCGTLLQAPDENTICLSCGKTWFRPRLLSEVKTLTDWLAVVQTERDELALFVMQDEQRSAEWIAKGPIPGQVLVYAIGDTRKEAVLNAMQDALGTAVQQSETEAQEIASALVRRLGALGLLRSDDFGSETP